jgi:hypothetical protein
MRRYAAVASPSLSPCVARRLNFSCLRNSDRGLYLVPPLSQIAGECCIVGDQVKLSTTDCFLGIGKGSSNASRLSSNLGCRDAYDYGLYRYRYFGLKHVLSRILPLCDCRGIPSSGETLHAMSSFRFLEDLACSR